MDGWATHFYQPTRAGVNAWTLAVGVQPPSDALEPGPGTAS